MSGAIELHVNGAKHTIDAPPQERLLTVLRDNLGLTGSKYGCGEGRCGACTVVIDGQAVRSCITLVDQCAGKQITTIEGLADGDKLHPLQEAFIAADAMQCGYCTAGMIMGGVALLQRSSAPTRQDIVAGMDGHICRCCTYARIVAAIEQAAGSAKGGA
jgi:aerobic-type carbon monoxide dehydrogenase small subunit (CoxS/CutS family)